MEESGRVTPGGTWYYTFEEPSRPSVVTQWRVSSQGAISSETYGSCGFENSVDMAPLLGLDSDAVVALALDYGVRRLLEGHKIEIIHGTARLAGTDRVEVKLNSDGSPQVLESKAIILATGGEPVSVPGLDFDNEHIVISTEA